MELTREFSRKFEPVSKEIGKIAEDWISKIQALANPVAVSNEAGTLMAVISYVSPSQRGRHPKNQNANNAPDHTLSQPHHTPAQRRLKSVVAQIATAREGSGKAAEESGDMREESGEAKVKSGDKMEEESSISQDEVPVAVHS